MAKITKEIDLALKNTTHLLSTISGERIRDEFIKGIKSAKSVKHFLGLLERYKLFDWIFRGLKVNNDFIEDRDPILVIASLLIGNDPSMAAKQLNNLKYTVDEAKSVSFLLNLLNLTPETAVVLKRAQKNSGVNDGQIEKFGRYHNIEPNLLKAFVEFKLTVSGDELMGQLNLKPGKELGVAINKAEYDNFKKLL
jgi:tRNA nucleotidyltransferase/poly(A) polymerase